MSKTPVSTLEEYVVKHRWEHPVYTLIRNASRNGEIAFTYRVTCRSLSAEGTASSKKDAKHAAAKELLKLLPTVSNFVQALRSTNGDLQKIDSYYLPGSCEVSHDDMFVNSVGKLHEYCATHKFQRPQYRDMGMKGPPHLPKFTIICSIGNLEMKAVAASKKKAKHDAAQAMLDKLVRNTSYKTSHDLRTDDARQAEIDIADCIENINILDLKVEQPSIAVDESASRAKSLYPGLENYRGIKKSSMTAKPNGSLSDSHLILKSSYEPLVRLAAIELIKENLCSVGLMRFGNKQEILNDVVSFLGLSVEYDILSNTPEAIIVICKLNSSPVITNAGIGNTYLDARDQATANVLESIDIFLS